MITRQRLFVISGTSVYQDAESRTVFFASNMTIDDDGDPFAYGPNGKGRDFLANAGHSGNWWGVVTDKNGKPVTQKINDPAPGYYVSTTSLFDPKKKWNDPNRFVNAWEIPFISIPAQLFYHVNLGDLGLAVHRGAKQPFIVADTGGRGHIGEGSPALARALEIDPDPKKGGLDTKTVGYMVFPKSGTGLPMTRHELVTRTNQVMALRGLSASQFFETSTTDLKKQHKLTHKVTVRR